MMMINIGFETLRSRCT